MENLDVQLTPETSFETAAKRVGFGPRLGAYLIDVVFVSLLGATFMFLFPSFVENLIDYSKLNELEGTPGYGFTETMMKVGVGSTILGFLYNLVEAFTGYTFGKFILGLQIANADASAPTLETLASRFALKNIGTILGIIAFVPALSFVQKISSVFGLAVVVGCFFVLGDKRQSFHDMIAKTAVFKRINLQA